MLNTISQPHAHVDPVNMQGLTIPTSEYSTLCNKKSLVLVGLDMLCWDRNVDVTEVVWNY
jgi:hypothetical protein